MVIHREFKANGGSVIVDGDVKGAALTITKSSGAPMAALHVAHQELRGLRDTLSDVLGEDEHWQDEDVAKCLNSENRAMRTLAEEVLALRGILRRIVQDSTLQAHGQCPICKPINKWGHTPSCEAMALANPPKTGTHGTR